MSKETRRNPVVEEILEGDPSGVPELVGWNDLEGSADRVVWAVVQEEVRKLAETVLTATEGYEPGYVSAIATDQTTGRVCAVVVRVEELGDEDRPETGFE